MTLTETPTKSPSRYSSPSLGSSSFVGHPSSSKATCCMHTAVTKSTTGCSFFWPYSTVVSTSSSTLGRTRTSKPLIGVYCSTVVNQNMRSAEFFIIWGEERSKGFTTRVSSWIIVEQNMRSAEFFIIWRKKRLHNTCLFLDSCEYEIC